MLSIVQSIGLHGLEGYLINVEVDTSAGLPSFDIVGLPDVSVKESKERVRTAIKNSGLNFESRKIIVNLSPANTRKEGSLFDLPIAVGILKSMESIENKDLSDYVFVGELSLDGKLNNSSSQTNANMVKWYAATPSLATSKQAPLRIGGTENRDSQNTQRNTKGQQSKNYMYVSNLQIYNKALTAEEVELYAGKNQLHKLADAYPLWDNLVGYWPCDLEEDQLEPIMKNYAKDNKENDDSDDFVIDRGVANAWTSGSEVSSGMHPIPESDITYYSKTFNTVDVSRQIFSWLGKTVRWDWNMEGKAWKLTYTQLSDENN